MSDPHGEDIRQHAVAINHLIDLAAQHHTLNERLTTAMERLEVRIHQREERQGQHEARIDASMQRQDTINERLTVATGRIDQTLAQLMRRRSNGREA
jgi:hypothetical protein